MLTEEQALGLRVEQGGLEDAELQQAKAQQKMDKYSQAIELATSSLASLSPEKQERVKALLPELQEGYEKAKGERAYAEDRYWQHLNHINNYKKLDEQQQQIMATGGGQRRRVVTPKYTNDQLRLQQYLNAGYFIGKDGWMYTPSGVLVNQNGYNLNSSGKWVKNGKAWIDKTKDFLSSSNGTQGDTATIDFSALPDNTIKYTSQYQPAPSEQYPNTTISAYDGQIPIELVRARSVIRDNGMYSPEASLAITELKDKGFSVSRPLGKAYSSGTIYRLTPIPSAWGWTDDYAD